MAARLHSEEKISRKGQVILERGSQSAVFCKFGAPVLGVCGFSGSGKTTLLEAVIPQLVARGLAVAVVKHDAHEFVIDRRGKDSDRFFRAGATVVLRGPSEQVQRRGPSASLSLEVTVAELARDHDVILVEGHKATNLPKIWLGDERNAAPPAEVTEILKVFPWNSERVETFLRFIEEWLPRAHKQRPLYAGLLVGGKSERMGRPKQMLEFRGRTLAETAAKALSSVLSDETSGASDGEEIVNPRLAILGAGEVPASLEKVTRLPDAPELAGPVAGLLAAHRWNPRAAWILAACDHPWLSEPDVKFLVEQRKPGTWAVMLRQADGYPYPTFALFEPQALEALERAVVEHGPQGARIAELIDHPRTVIRQHATRGLFNANTPEEFENASAMTEGHCNDLEEKR